MKDERGKEETNGWKLRSAEKYTVGRKQKLEDKIELMKLIEMSVKKDGNVENRKIKQCKKKNSSLNEIWMERKKERKEIHKKLKRS